MRGLGARIPRGAYVAAALGSAALLNVAVGAGVGIGEQPKVLAFGIAALPVLLIGFGMLVERHRAVLAWIALALTFTGLPIVVEPLPLPGGTSVFATDVLLLLAIGAWIAARLTRSPTRQLHMSPIFGWPLVILGITIMSGVVIGNERYGASIIAQPFRIVLYSGIALALVDVAPRDAWRAISRVFYAGAFVQALYAAYYLATGGSQTQSVALSTGGTRVLALTVSIYLTGSLVCALLNLELETRPGRQFLHLAVGGLALFGIIVSFGRTTYAAVALILPALILTRRYMRRSLIALAPLIGAALVLIVLVIPLVAPTVIPTLTNRLVGTSSSDLNVRWREYARDAALEGIEGQRLTGLGFGRVSQFRIEGEVVTIHGDPHNSYVYLYAGGGAFALASFLVVCVVFLLDAIRRLRRAAGVDSALIAWAVATWLAFMVNALAGPIFSDSGTMMTMWILMTLPSLVVARQAAPSLR